jgi:hypothetical protein
MGDVMTAGPMKKAFAIAYFGASSAATSGPETRAAAARGDAVLCPGGLADGGAGVLWPGASDADRVNQRTGFAAFWSFARSCVDPFGSRPLRPRPDRAVD